MLFSRTRAARLLKQPLNDGTIDSLARGWFLIVKALSYWEQTNPILSYRMTWGFDSNMHEFVFNLKKKKIRDLLGPPVSLLPMNCIAQKSLALFGLIVVGLCGCGFKKGPRSFPANFLQAYLETCFLHLLVDHFRIPSSPCGFSLRNTVSTFLPPPFPPLITICKEFVHSANLRRAPHPFKTYLA